MARHILSDDIEIWDPSGLGEANWTYYPEGRGGEWNKIPEGYEHLPTHEPIPLPQNMPDDYMMQGTHGRDAVPVTDDNPDGWGERPKEEWHSVILGGHGSPNYKVKLHGFNEKSSWGDSRFPGPRTGWEEPELELPWVRRSQDRRSRDYREWVQRDKPYTPEEIRAAHEAHYTDENHQRIFYPWTGATPGDTMAKIMMLPQEFLNLAPGPKRESRHESSLNRIKEGIENNAKVGGKTPIGMPYLMVEMDKQTYGQADPRLSHYPGPSSGKEPLSGPMTYQVYGHEGRHRMQSFIDMGLGDIPVPVLTAIKDSQKHSWGIDPGRRSRGWEASLPGSTFLPQLRGKTSENRPFTVRDVNTVWGRGKYEDLRER